MLIDSFTDGSVTLADMLNACLYLFMASAAIAGGAMFAMATIVRTVDMVVILQDMFLRWVQRKLHIDKGSDSSDPRD